MKEAENVLQRLRLRGEEFFAQVSAELMANPRFMKALESAWKGKAKLDAAVARTLKNMNIPTRTEFKRTLRRIELLEEQVAELKRPRPARRRTTPASSRPRRSKGSAES